MCDTFCIDFVAKNLHLEDIENKKVLEVGAYNVNGSVRAQLKNYLPASYLGVDIEEGPCVDEVCSVHDLIKKYGSKSYDVVVTTEMLEHIVDYQDAFLNLKSVVKPNGILLITTRAPGFPYHEYPTDHWRFTEDFFKQAFSDWQINTLEVDESSCGIFFKAKKNKQSDDKLLINQPEKV